MNGLNLLDLPVGEVLEDVVAASRDGAVVLTAPPGSGKTMLVPGAVLDDLADDKQVIVLQPRRLAARAVASRIARLRNGKLGEEVGYQVRFDARCGPSTRLLVVTTGILLRRLLDDIVLEEVGAIVLDEFHERTIEMDLVLGLLIRIRDTLRPDLRIVVMSATLAVEPVARRLGDCAVVRAEGRRFAVKIQYARRDEQRPLVDLVADRVPVALRETEGHVLVFLPGFGEIMRCMEALAPLAKRHSCELLSLFGDLAPDEQDRVLEEFGRRKIILATNVAETSLTIEGVTAVVDSGQARQMQVAPTTGLPRLELVSVSQASAEQRAGRAGRTGPGVCWRLWSEPSHQARPLAEAPEVLRGDLAAALLQLIALGEYDDFPWLDAPPAEAVAGALELLEMLEAIDSRHRITALGQELSRLPTHPRLGRLLLAGASRGVLRETSIAAALLSERDPFRSPQGARAGPRDHGMVRSRSDIVDRVGALKSFQEGASGADGDLSPHAGGARNVLRAGDQLYRLVAFPRTARAECIDVALMQALLEAFPDRLCKLRPGTQDRAVMVGGRGVRIDPGSRVRGEALFLAVELNDWRGEARARLVSAVDRAWLTAGRLRVAEELFFNPTRRQVEARLRTYWGDLLLEETPVAIGDLEACAKLLAKQARTEWARIVPDDDSPAGRFLARARWLLGTMPELELPSLEESRLMERLPEVCRGLRSLEELRSADWLSFFQGCVGYDRLAEIDRLAPPELVVPSGNRHPIRYAPGKAPVLEVRIQELFGLRETPRVGGGREAVVVHLLGPNYRPQQVTSDLASFWKNGYPEVKKELRRRYPKHAWPDDPLTTQATRSGLKRDMR